MSIHTHIYRKISISGQQHSHDAVRLGPVITLILLMMVMLMCITLLMPAQLLYADNNTNTNTQKDNNTQQTPPPLPAGLSDSEPALPSGLSDNNEPALPGGLGDDDNVPALPSGLADNNAPALPAGLANGQPPLPPGLAHGNPSQTSSQNQSQKSASLFNLPPDWRNAFTGFWEARMGLRTSHDAHEHRLSISETRFQLEWEKNIHHIDYKITSDLVYDPFYDYNDLNLDKGRGFLDLREACMTFSPADFMDVKLGRQVLTWGTGDLIFINDMFPKDWQSFFIGRDDEYLKAPSDAVKLSMFSDLANIDIVYSPLFDSDRYIDGRRLSYWNPAKGSFAGQDHTIHTDTPNRWFRDQEFATRITKNINGYELAGYGYWGYWKSPVGMNPATGHATFPRLSVYGTSLRGQVGSGIGNMEFGYYDSRQDRHGDNMFVKNSQYRFLLGYEQDLPQIAHDLTVGVQYYLEWMAHYDAYRNNLPPNMHADDKDRHLVTFRITKLLMNQNLSCSLFTYYSPTDQDVYMRPKIHYKVTDNLAVETGANIFFGAHRYTFFSQFQNNTNIYTAIRYSF